MDWTVDRLVTLALDDLTHVLEDHVAARALRQAVAEPFVKK